MNESGYLIKREDNIGFKGVITLGVDNASDAINFIGLDFKDPVLISLDINSHN